MRLLFVVPHFFQSRADAPRHHGSLAADPRARVEALSSAILALHQQFGREQSMIQIAARRTQPANEAARAEVHVVVCTTLGQHLVPQLSLDHSLYQHYSTDVEPQLLGYQCHSILRDRWGNYDYYGYLEDDVIVHDPWLFVKLAWFNRCVGGDKLLQPNRFERGPGPRDQKVYVDGDLAPRVTAPFQNVQDEPRLNSQVMAAPLVFQRPLNPHAGCFFLDSDQLQHWMCQSYFLDRDTSFIGPLESAATLGIMRAFKVYKPARENANFLEVEHHGRTFLSQIRYGRPAHAENEPDRS